MTAGELTPQTDGSDPVGADPAGDDRPDEDRLDEDQFDDNPFDPLDPPHVHDPSAPYDPNARVPLPGRTGRPLVPRWCGVVLIGLGLLTLPWIARLAVSLPNRVQTDHYAFSWAGFDVLLAALLLWTGWRAVRNREDIGVAAAVTAGLLVVDAWFDVTSASSTGMFLIALAMALFVELPLAGFCLWLAGRAESARRRRAARLVAMVGRLWQARSRPLRR
ncbi:MAG: hypothetical protein HOW97_40725, partial [Catenulispora sp.]|nr:hypothetical protein [Catenulispora sp.]